MWLLLLLSDDNDDDCDIDDVNVNTLNSGAGNKVDDDGDHDEFTSKVDDDDDDDDESTEVEEQAQVCLNEPNSLLEDTPNYDGPFWAKGTVGSKTEQFVLSAITTYNNIDGLHGLRFTPQYGFNRGVWIGWIWCNSVGAQR